MTATNLPPGYCGAIADELRRVADVLDSIGHIELPEPRLFLLNIQPGGQTDAEIIAAVDALGLALLGKKGEYGTASGSPWYSVDGERGPVTVSAYRQLSAAPDERDDELARLRAEVEQLRAERAKPLISDEMIAAVPETGERVDIGAAGCGCPVTEEIRPNGSSIDGTERVEHRPKCWNEAES